MKRLFAIIILVIVAITACSKNSSTDTKAHWESSIYHEADELTDTPSYYTTTYVDDNRSVDIESYSEGSELFVTINDNIFDYDGCFVDITIGFYKDCTLIDRKTVSVYVSSREPNNMFISDDCLVDRILFHLINVGDVRIVAPLYQGREDFDITLPMNPNFKLLKRALTKSATK